MKRKILVLDAFTNGHQAALVFIRRQSWMEVDCEIVFCGTHSKILKRLSEGLAYAVVPVSNSTIGEISEVTKELELFRRAGYDLRECDKFDLQVNHHLLVPRHINRPEELAQVISKEQAIQQCSLYLDRIGVPADRRSKCDSTGNAAKSLSKVGLDAKIGVIASKEAAEEYGLKILAENIQDIPDNKTTFILLENTAEVKQRVIGIIGINGLFGQMLKGFFERLKCQVIGSDKNKPTELNNIQVVEQAEVVIFAVPVRDTPEVIRSVLPYTREDQLLMDVTSVKKPAVEAMLEGKSQVVGLHPMFRPEGSFDGQTVVVCSARSNLSVWKSWVANVLSATGASIKWSNPFEHDGYMAVVQANPHLANLASAVLIAEEDISVVDSLEFTSPFYRILFSLMGRLIGQNPGLYTDIAMENPRALEIFERRIEIEQRMLKMIREKDRASFEKLFAKAKDHFGSDVIREANELFMRLLGVLNTLYGKNSITLEFTKAVDNPGLLENISRVFRERKINLAGINSVALDKERRQFTISFEQSKSSEEVRHALEEIESWQGMSMKVVG